MNQQNIIKAIKRLRHLYPGGGALEVGTPYHMLTMVILSARTRDEQVLKLAPTFFKHFPTAQSLAVAELADVTVALGSIGMFRQKAKNVLAMAQAIVERHDGRVPSTMDELVELPGVGRKTASVILAALFHTPAVAVDTHVARVTHRLGWTTKRTPLEIERDLLKKIPRELWTDVNHVFVPFGRAVCTPTPRCWSCPIVDVCAYKKKNLDTPKNSSEILAAAKAQQDTIERLKNDLAQTL